jgi:MYXO-CTERM domain-containing protein
MNRRRAPSATLLGLAAILCGAAPAARADDQQRLQQQLDLAAFPAVRLEVRKSGWTRVDRAALLAAGLDANAETSGLRLFADGAEQPMVVTGDAVEFHGVARDTAWGDTRTYWLVAGAVPGRRVPLLASPRGAAAPSSFVRTQVVVERKNYLAALRNGDDTNFLGGLVSADGLSQSVSVKHPVSGASVPVLTVTLQGVSMGAHQVQVSVNGQPAGACAFEARALKACPLPLGDLPAGDHQVVLTAAGAAPDLSMLKSLRLDYPHAFEAEDDALELTAPPMTHVSLAGFSSPDVRVVDVTDPESPVELAVTATAEGARYVAQLDTPASAVSGARALLAFTAATVGRPARVAASRPSSWTGALRGELVILSHASFLDAVAPLAARRAQEGLSAQAIDLQDVYDAFGAGDKSAFAIRAFLRHARAHWAAPPRFVLLVGDASFDPRDFLGKGDFDFAPTKLIDTQGMETASDDWFVEDDDGLPQLAIGRFPVRTPAQAESVVAKTLAWRPGAEDAARDALFVADPDEAGLMFSEASAASEAVVGPWLPVERFVRGQSGATPEALLSRLQQGPLLVNYFGHGSVEQWDGLFSSAAAATLVNPRLSIYVNMNCLNGFFHDLYTHSLAEALLQAPGGAVAVWASSTLTAFAPQASFNASLLAGLRSGTLGEAGLAAKRAVADADADVRRTWILFGDPTLRATEPPPTPADGGAPDGGASDAGNPTPDGATADAGADQRVAADAATVDTGGTPSKPGDGCGCQTGGAAAPQGAALLALAWALARRRVRRSSAR